MQINLYASASALLLILTTTFSSCKKDDSFEGSGSASIELEHVWNEDDFSLNKAFTTDSNQQATFTTLKYIVSNFVFVNENGAQYAIKDSCYLIDISAPASTLLSFSNIPSGNYKSVHFWVGVDSTHNVSGNISGLSSMYQNASNGYTFMKAEGSSPQSGSGFLYHISGYQAPNAAQRAITIDFGSSSLQVRQSKKVQLHTSVNVEKLFTGINISTLPQINTAGANALKMANNYATLFSFEHIHN